MHFRCPPLTLCTVLLVSRTWRRKVAGFVVAGGAVIGVAVGVVALGYRRLDSQLGSVWHARGGSPLSASESETLVQGYRDRDMLGLDWHIVWAGLARILLSFSLFVVSHSFLWEYRTTCSHTRPQELHVNDSRVLR